MTDNELILKALYSALEDCYSPELIAEYQRLIKEREERDLFSEIMEGFEYMRSTREND